MWHSSRVFFLFVSILAVAVLIVGSSLPLLSQTLEWLTSPVTVTSRISASPDNSNLITLKGNVHPLATAKFDQGIVGDNLPMEHLVMLLQRSPDQEQMLTAVIDGQKNRHSELYHHWLTPETFSSHFGPASADIAVVTSWLQSQGFKVEQVTKGRTAVIFSGTAGQVQTAFHTEIHYLNVNGETHISNMSEPKIPIALAPVVRGLRSLNNFFPKPLIRNAGQFHRNRQNGEIQRVSGTQPSPNFTDTTDGVYLVGPQDFYTIYHENPLLANGINGAGTTLAVVEETDIVPADVTTFRTAFALPPYPASPNNTQGGVNYMFGVSGYCSDPGILTDGEEGEADIDVQWEGTVAPNATIDFVSCASTTTTAGIDLTAMYIVNNLASTVSAFSESYGLCEVAGGSAAGAFYTDLWEQAAAQGQTVSVSAGDSGSMGCDQNAQFAVNPIS
ncbi:MAG: protease pro-enzyme activation domain-containing protein, partial [Terriglobales bacterium]